MQINWFPGHMTKTVRMMQEHAKLVDCFICVLDSRAPKASVNPQFLAIAGTKPILYVLNKSDMVEHNDLEKWADFYKLKNIPFVIMDSTSGKGRAQIVSKLKEINAEKLQKFASKGVNKSIRAMVAGIPNSGKSTLINSLAGSKKTVTGDKAGVTRGKQWINLAKGLELMDTPGTLPPNINDEEASTHLAMIGSINDEIIDREELALEIAAFYKANDEASFCARYGLGKINLSSEKEELSSLSVAQYQSLPDDFKSSESGVLTDVAQKRGFFMKGGVPDTLRAAKAIVEDFRKQRIAKTILEFPDYV